MMQWVLLIVCWWQWMTCLAIVLAELGLKKGKKKDVNWEYMLPKCYAPWHLGTWDLWSLSSVPPCWCTTVHQCRHQYMIIILSHDSHHFVRPFHVAAGSANWSYSNLPSVRFHVFQFTGLQLTLLIHLTHL